MLRLKVILIILLNLLIAIKANAQNFHGRLIAGLNVAQVDGDSYGGYNQPGALFGISVLKKPNEKYHYGFELCYSQKGSHKKTTEDDPDPFQLRYNYITMPLFVDFYNLGVHLKKVHLRLGISNNIRVISKVNFGGGWVDNPIKPYELSGIFGVGYNINEQFDFSLRHENSILSVGEPANNPNFYKINRTALRNRLVSFVLSYEF